MGPTFHQHEALHGMIRHIHLLLPSSSSAVRYSVAAKIDRRSPNIEPLQELFHIEKVFGQTERIINESSTA
jgi:hypothetical protein